MSVSDLAPLSFIDELGIADLSVADAHLRTVARGVGSLHASLPAGLYRLEARAGLRSTARLIELEPGQPRHETATVEVGSPVPLEGTANSREDHQAVVMEASRQLIAVGLTGMVIVVRAVGEVLLEAETLRTLELLDLGGDATSPPWQIDHTAGIACAVMPMSPGGYALRNSVETAVETASPPVYLEQAVNVVPGYETLVFVPSTSYGPRLEMASIQMVTSEWSPSEAELPGSLAAEVMLEGLRIGNVTVPEFDEHAILHNPMLGAIAVHAIVACSNPDLERAQRLARLTETSLHGGSDAAGLSYVVEERHARDENRSLRPQHMHPVSEPPMLRASYDALVRCDIAQNQAFIAGSSAERTGELLVNRGIWTTWIRGVREPRPRWDFPVPVGPVSFPIRLADIGSDDTAVQSLGPGARRIASFLVSVAAAAARDPETTASTVDERLVASACGLPISTVRRAYEELTSMLLPVA